MKKYIYITFLLLLGLSLSLSLNAQSLTCVDAEVLCSLGELDDFEGTMPATNPFDEPLNFCGGTGNPQNMSWFAFIAGSASAVLELDTDNCNNGNTIQYGIYTDCNYDESIICQGSAVNANNTITLNLNGMVPGDDYFFFIDGDLGTYCDYSINVVSGGDPVPVPNPDGIICVGGNCPPDNNVCGLGNTYTFEADGLDLSIEYSWTIEPLPPGFPPNPQTFQSINSIDLSFAEIGIYDICMTATNGCTTTDEVCIEFELFEADAGTLDATPNPLCPGETSTVTVSDYTMSVPTTETLIVVGPDGIIIDIGDAPTIDVTYDACGVLTVYSYNYITDNNPGVPTIGETYAMTDCVMFCCDVESIEIDFNDSENPVFTDAPSDITMDCTSNISDIPLVTWTDNCDGTGTVTGDEIQDYNSCDGGTITRTWLYTDECMNEVEHTQVITLNPAPPPIFVDPPMNVTLDCDQLPGPIEDLELSNGEDDPCTITGTASGTESSTFDVCTGGVITRTWDFTDMCGNDVSYTQLITINPPPLAEFVDPPGPITVACDEIPTSFPTLSLSNGEMGDCLITGTQESTVTNDVDFCGGDIDVIWIFTDECNRITSHVQIITVLPASLPVFVDPPDDIILTCAGDLEPAEDLDYSNSEDGDCLITGTITPVTVDDIENCSGTRTNTWTVIDDCNRTTTETQIIVINPPAEPAFIDAPADITISCDEIPDTPPTLSYDNGEMGDCLIMGEVLPVTDDQSDICGGMITNTWEFIDDCNRSITHNQVITVEPAPEAEFIDPPANVSIDCDEPPPTAIDLDYSNSLSGNCSISGTIVATIEDNSNTCGGNLIYTWEFEDDCMRTITHTQTITIIEAPLASFTSLPMNETIACSESLTPAGPLDYTNNDDCLISGSINPIIEDNTDLCGGTITNTWDFTDDCGRNLNHVQIITKEPTPQATFIDPPANGTVACNSNTTTPADLDYSNGEMGLCEISGTISPVESGGFDACGGEIVFTWEFEDECERVIQHVQTIIVDPAPIAAFIDPPDEITVDCADFNIVPPSLSYSNGESDVCEISGSVEGTLQNTPNPCGTTVQYRWEFEDDCGRTITHTQNVNISIAAEATFTTLPTNTTIDCDAVPSIVPSLSYTNGASGICEITGAANGIQSGSFNECGGDITYTWTFTDDCNRVITHSQELSINPAANPSFIDPPPDYTLDCGEVFPVNPTLNYSNAETGNCSINGTAIATTTTNGNITSYTWEFAHPCTGDLISYVQNVTGVATPMITLDPSQLNICYGSEYDLNDISVTELNGNSFTATFLDENGNPLTNPVVSPNITTIYGVVATNGSGCSDTAFVTINIDNPPTAGMAGTAKICDGDTAYNLFDFLNGAYEPNGTWFDTDGSGVNMDDPTSIFFSDVVGGFYDFTYVVYSTNSCPDGMAVVTIEVIEELEIEILEVECEANGSTFHINVYSGGNTIVSTVGDVTVVDANNVVVNNIPSGQFVVISAFDADGLCNTNINVNAPDCDCPNIDPPMGTDEVICEGDDIPFLSVTVPSGFQANWYETATGTTPILSNSLTFMPSIPSTPGTYIYFVESEDPEGCVSIFRTEVKLTINSMPALNVIEVPLCEDDDGNINVVLSDLNTQINNNVNFTFTYFESLSDAESSSNPLDDSYVNDATISIVVKVENTSGCIAYADVILTESPIPTYTLEAIDETCIGNDDGMLVITNILPSNTVFSMDNISFNATSLIENLEPNNYVLYAMTDDECISNENFEIGEGLDIFYENIEITCNDNNSNTDSSDDYYTISFTLSNNIGLTDIVNLSTVNEDLGDFNFGDISFDLPAGASQLITVLHVASGCTIEFVTGELNPCSSSCSISVDPITIVCQGNDTPSDPNDDYYEITINASVINGASNNSFNVLVNDIIVNNFQYNVGGTITIPAMGQTVNLSIVDNEDEQCFNNEVLGPLTPCSDVCVLTIDNYNFICDNQSTIGVNEDDTYSFTFEVTSINSTSSIYQLFIDDLYIGDYDYDQLYEYIIPADELVHTIQFIDGADELCLDGITSPILDYCSGSCSVSPSIVDIDCDHQMTSDDELDDTFTVDVKIDMIGGSGNWLIPSLGLSGSSGQTITVGPFDISGGDVSLEITDSNTATCLAEILLVAPEPCSTCEGWVMAGNDEELNCDITEVILTGTSSGSGQDMWEGPGGFMEEGTSVTVNIPGDYIYSIDLGDSCFKSDTLTISVSDDIPVAYAGSNQSITCNQDSVFLTGSVVGGIGPFEYRWLDNNLDEISDEIEIKVGLVGNYYFEVYDQSTDCTSPLSLVEVIDDTNPPEAIILANPGNLLDCIVKSISLSTDEKANNEYEWYINNVLTNVGDIVIYEASEIVLKVYNLVTGCENEDALNITSIQEYPIIDVQPVEELSCNNQSVTIDISQSQSGPNINSTWMNEDGNIIAIDEYQLDVTLAGTYYIELIDINNNCSNIDTIEVTGNSASFDLQLDPIIIALVGDEVILEANINIITDDISSIKWTPAIGLSCDTCLLTELTILEDIDSYSILVIDVNGCEEIATIKIISNEEVIITIPNVINTDNGGDNGFLSVFSTDTGAIIKNFSIYDRWGGRLFISNSVLINDPQSGWDGTFKGEDVGPGVYVFDVEILLSSGETVRDVGDFTIIR